MKIVERLVSSDGSIKYIFQSHNGYYCEAIYYRLPPKNNTPYERYHICISSQFGCKMKCSFCDTGNLGFCHNLSSEEMLEEISLVHQDIIKSGKEKASTKYSAVIMGMGEPLNNLDFKNARKVSNLITRIHKENPDAAILMVTHCRIFPAINRLITLKNGVIVPNEEEYTCHSCFGKANSEGFYE